MLRIILVVTVCSVVTSFALGETSPTEPQANSLAAESLRQSARTLAAAPARTPARAARLVAMIRMANRLEPQNASTNALLADVYEAQGKAGPASQALQVCLSARPEDHATGVRWIVGRVASLNNASQRIAFLQSVVDQADAANALRAEAAVRLGELFERRAATEDARKAYRKALSFIPYHSAARRHLLAIHPSLKFPKLARQAEALLCELRTNPLAINLAWELGDLLSRVGLYSQAAEMFDYAWAVFLQRNTIKQASPLFVTQHFNALLDADKHAEAAARFTPILESFPNDTNLQSLMVEALRASGDEQKANEIIAAMEARYLDANHTPASPAELAWFYLLTKPDPQRALGHAESAAKDSNAPVIQRILGSAELQTDRADQGADRLDKVMERDVYAAAILAEHYFANDDRQGGLRAIAAAVNAPRGGPAFRKLRAVAAANDANMPTPPESEAITSLVGVFDRRHIQMGLHPEQFLSVEIRPRTESFAPGEPIVVDAVLTNRGTLAVPIGQWGLVNPTMTIEVRTKKTGKKVFRDVPLAIWPAPRFLSPGATTIVPVRLDGGDLGKVLFAHPLERYELTVTGMLDPIQQGGAFRSSLPSIQSPAATIIRRGLHESADGAATPPSPLVCRQVLDAIAVTFLRGDLPDRMLASRQTASLLAMAGAADQGTQNLPKWMTDVFDKPVLSRLLRAAFEDRSFAVRGEALAALGGVKLDRATLPVLGVTFNDPHPLVRFRAAELLGASGTKGRQSILQYLSRDADPLVKEMATAFGPKPARQQRPQPK